TLEPEASARPLALAIDGRNGAVGYALEPAADHAALRGAPAAAAELAELAAERTPREDEDARFRRLNEAGLRYAIAGDFQQARAVLEPLGDELPPGPMRARVLLNLADVRWDGTPELIALAKTPLATVDDET